MQNNFNINSELKDLLLNDDDIKKKILIALLHIIYKNDNSKDHEHFTLSEYEAIKKLLEKDNELYTSLSNTLKDIINDNVINDIVKTYKDMSMTESTHLLDSLSRLLYIQDKYKDGEIGQRIDTKIKEWLDLIKKYQNKEVPKNDNDIEQLKKSIVIYKALTFYQIVPNFNYHIYDKNDFNTPFMELWNYDNVDMETIHAYLLNYINNKLNDSDTYTKYIEDINNFINGIESNINIANFNKDEENTIKEIRKKYGVKLDDSSDYVVPSEKEKDFFDELVNALMNYEKTNGFNIQDKDDIKKWHTKSDSFINHLETYDGIALYGLFTMDYTLNHLAYNDYQKEAYKLDLEDDIKVVNDNTNLKESQEEQQKGNKKATKKASIKQVNDEEIDETPISKLRNHSLKHKDTLERDYIMMSSTKQGNDLINGITSYASYNESAYSIQKRIKELENSKNKSASDNAQLNYLKEKLENRLITKEEIEKEKKELLNNKKEISEKLKELVDKDDITNLTRIDKQIDKRINEIDDQLNNKTLTIQQSLFNSDIRYNGKYITTSINIDDFDLSKFTDDGITILLYMIDQIITNPDITELTFDIDFIFNKMNNYKHNKKSIVRNEIKNLTDILYNMNIKVIKEDKLNNLEIGRELRVITGRQWTKDKKAIKDDNGLKSMTITFNDDFKKMILNSKTIKTKLGDTKQVNNLQYFKIPLDLITFKNKRARNLGLYILQQAKLNRKNIEKGQPLKRKMKDLYFNDYLKLKYNKKQGQFKKDIVYKLEDYLNQLEDNKIILYNTDAFDKLRYDLSNRPIEEQKKIFDEEIIEIKVIPQITSDDNEATKK